MDDTIHATLAGWGNFYQVTGAAAAALTGLQFIVQTLLASNAFRPATSGDPEAGTAAFGTPTVVHFTLALLLSAVLCAPWPRMAGCGRPWASSARARSSMLASCCGGRSGSGSTLR